MQRYAVSVTDIIISIDGVTMKNVPHKDIIQLITSEESINIIEVITLQAFK
jgi:C-terminal processing protease CtpA/Prc